jgi:Putative Flp pilus-assembly TadE/G-like
MNSKRWQWRSERGQTMLIAVLVISIFLLGFIGLAVDFSGLWFKRQAAQAAADSACQAGAMNMLLVADGVGTTTSGFTVGNSFNCATASWPDPAHQPTPCWYAQANGYAGATTPTDIQTGDTEADAVEVTFPSSVPGVTTPPSSVAGAHPFMQVEVTDRAKVFLPSLFTGRSTQPVKATARCGLVLTTAPIPIIVLHPTMSNAFDVGGNSTVRIYGGPSQSIQVNSSDATQATNIQGSTVVDLTQGGPDHTGSDLGTWGGPALQPPASQFPDPTGSTVDWLYKHFPISDPFATVPVPSIPPLPAPTQNVTYAAGAATATTDPYCPPSVTCVRHYPGYYSAGLTIKQENALFVSGIYYLGGDLNLLTKSMVRPSAWIPTPDIKGTMFYLAGNSIINIDAQSGTGDPNGTGLTPFPVGDVQCPVPNGAAPDPPLTGPLTGNVFLGPCVGTYADVGVDGAVYRGMLFFHDRNGTGDNTMNGGGGLLVAGDLYFHQNTSYGTRLGLWGGTSSDTRILGNIVVDQLYTRGNSGINMQLNPNAVHSILTVELLQ